jgi:aldehyde dehydrogenase (NAD+)
MTELSVAPPALRADDVQGAVERLRATFDAGRTRPVAWREQQLRGLHALLSEQEDQLVDALVADLRRTPFEALLFDIVPSKAELRHNIKHLRRWMRPRKVRTPAGGQPGRSWYQYEPLGVTLVISPWNYPVHLGVVPLAQAFAAGNCAVLKPSEMTPACAGVLSELLPRYTDPEAVTVVQGGPVETLALIEQRPDHCFFTGSPAVGRQILAAAAPHLIPVTLELGGKCPAIVTSSANLEVAARRIAFGKLVNSGQTCVAPDYVLVDRQVRDEFVDRLVATIHTFSEGRMVPIVNERHAERIAALLHASGGRIALGGQIDSQAMIGQPTVVVDPDPGSPLLSEEIFGPVLPVVTVDSLASAIDQVRAGSHPLASYLFTEDRSDEATTIERLSTGATVINHVMVHLSVSDLPFGGVGTSGMGAYHGHWGFETFSHPKAIVRKPSRLDLQFIYPPYSARTEKLLRRLL